MYTYIPEQPFWQWLLANKQATWAYLQNAGLFEFKAKQNPHRFEVFLGHYDKLPPAVQAEVERHAVRTHWAILVFAAPPEAFQAATLPAAVRSLQRQRAANSRK